MKLIVVSICLMFLMQDQIPYKANDEFELKLDLQFKKRPASEGSKIDMEKRTLPTSGMSAPYLNLNLRVLKEVAQEVRVKVEKNDGQTILSRKFDTSVVIKLDLGFTDDIKDHVSANHYIVTFLTKERSPLSRVEIFFEEDGTYIVNGEKRGKI